MVLSVIGTLQRLQLPTAHYLRTACTEYMTLGHVVTHIPVATSHLSSLLELGVNTYF